MGLVEQLDDMRRRISELERRAGSKGRTGVVTEVDAANGLARVQLTGGDAPLVTGWIPWAEQSAGANKTHNPPSVGQQVEISSESGDLHDASIQGSLNSAANGRPSAAGDEFVLLSVGGASIKASGGGSEIVIAIGGYSLTLSASGTVEVGGTKSHNGKNIGDTHTHKGVMSGPSNTGTPN
ncbi:phage baseplate assembly protein V [Aliiroseovarius lamellibrachiae]|uniref:phage baseplate assembly protein V n=1 Tax=Aliiroseovarius lamellibrachiae TaxID=1924933 RepID=UPI001BDFDE1F|nr:phage baseplate assembly protein V [Aliiroseovarius lamellibrachiae]MBT2130120.1 phage baseplate assembly protein V [Aliiroseovarius lamellibrachiae]